MVTARSASPVIPMPPSAERPKTDSMPSYTDVVKDRSPTGPQRAAVTKIETRSLNFFYGERQALFDISLAIPERSVMAFIGPSGCGKSTFLRTLNR